ncbi:DUF4177 domain-containing protein, partial [Streptomyces sp. NPDC001130]
MASPPASSPAPLPAVAAPVPPSRPSTSAVPAGDGETNADACHASWREHGRGSRHGRAADRPSAARPVEKVLNKHAEDGWSLKAITAADVKGRIGPGSRGGSAAD